MKSEKCIVMSNNSINAASPQERARLRLTSVGPVINQMMAEQQAKQAKKDAAKEVAPVAPQAAEPEKSGLPADPKDWSMKDLLESKPLPEDIDPFSRTLLGGVDPIAVHQAMTVVIPILCQLGEQSRVLYSPHRLRWMCGMSWQMGVSGSGKSEVQRELEKLFLSKDLKENSMNAKEASKYSLLSEKEKKETPVPEEKVRIFMGLPTSLALVQQMQVNDGGAIYISCTECGEFGKKIAQTSYNAIPDMMKRSYDGTGEEYIHKTLQGSLYVPSMKLNANFSGTIDPVFKVFRYNNADGTLSRCNLTILPRRKDEEKEGVYKEPHWAMKERIFLRECADRLRTFNNKFHENEKPDEIDECNALLEKYGLRADENYVPTVQDLEDCVYAEQCDKAVCIPEVLELGRDIKKYLVSFGDMAADSCSRANERAMGLCYLLLIANGFAPLRNNSGDEIHSGEAWTAEDRQLLSQCINTARWWIDISIDCALALQSILDLHTPSVKNGVLAAFGETVKKRALKEAARQAAFLDIETKHRGEEVPITVMREYKIFANLDRSMWYRLAEKRGWEPAKKGLFRLPEPTQEDTP